MRTYAGRGRRGGRPSYLMCYAGRGPHGIHHSLIAGLVVAAVTLKTALLPLLPLAPSTVRASAAAAVVGARVVGRLSFRRCSSLGHARAYTSTGAPPRKHGAAGAARTRALGDPRKNAHTHILFKVTTPHHHMWRSRRGAKMIRGPFGAGLVHAFPSTLCARTTNTSGERSHVLWYLFA